MSVPHKKKKKKAKKIIPIDSSGFPCRRCGRDIEEEVLEEDNSLCMECLEDDADYIDSTMELD